MKFFSVQGRRRKEQGLMKRQGYKAERIDARDGEKAKTRPPTSKALMLLSVKFAPEEIFGTFSRTEKHFPPHSISLGRTSHHLIICNPGSLPYQIPFHTPSTRRHYSRKNSHKQRARVPVRRIIQTDFNPIPTNALLKPRCRKYTLTAQC